MTRAASDMRDKVEMQTGDGGELQNSTFPSPTSSR